MKENLRDRMPFVTLQNACFSCVHKIDIDKNLFVKCGAKDKDIINISDMRDLLGIGSENLVIGYSKATESGTFNFPDEFRPEDIEICTCYDGNDSKFRILTSMHKQAFDNMKKIKDISSHEELFEVNNDQKILEGFFLFIKEVKESIININLENETKETLYVEVNKIVDEKMKYVEAAIANNIKVKNKILGDR